MQDIEASLRRYVHRHSSAYWAIESWSTLLLCKVYADGISHTNLPQRCTFESPFPMTCKRQMLLHLLLILSGIRARICTCKRKCPRDDVSWVRGLFCLLQWIIRAAKLQLSSFHVQQTPHARPKQLSDSGRKIPARAPHQIDGVALQQRRTARSPCRCMKSPPEVA